MTRSSTTLERMTDHELEESIKDLDRRAGNLSQSGVAPGGRTLLGWAKKKIDALKEQSRKHRAELARRRGVASAPARISASPSPSPAGNPAIAPASAAKSAVDAATRAVKQRFRDVLNHAEAKDRQNLALHLLQNTDLDVAAIINLLRAAGTERKRSQLATLMRNYDPQVAADFTPSPREAAKMPNAAQIYAGRRASITKAAPK